LDRRLGELQSQPGRGGEEKNSHPLSGLETPIMQPVALRYITELSRLLIKNKCVQNSGQKIRRGRDYLGGLGVDGRIILKRFLKKQSFGMWTGFIWLRRGWVQR
jgi:hypothetical protein